MSCPTTRWARDISVELNLPLPQHTTLIALAIRANSDRYCWPSVALIAREARLSERATQVALRALEARGLLRREYRERQSAVYHLACPATAGMGAPPAPTPPDMGAGPAPAPAPPAPTPPQEVHPEGVSKKQEGEAIASPRAAAQRAKPREVGDLFEPPSPQPRRAAPVKPKKPIDPEYDRLWKEGPARLRAVFPNWTAKDAQVAVGRLLKESMRAPRPIWEVIEAAERQDAISEPWPWLNSRLARALRQPPPPVDRGYGPTKEGQIAFAEEARIRAVWEARQAQRQAARA